MNFWAGNIVAWLIVAGVSAGTVFGFARPGPFSEILLHHIVGWAPWVMISWLAFRAAPSLALDSGEWKKSLPLFAFIGVLWMAAYSVYVVNYSRIMRGEALSILFNPVEERTGFWLFFDYGFYMLVIAIAYIWTYLARYHRQQLATLKAERRVREVELELLRDQLRPHFLFNALNTVVGLTRTGQNTAAVDVLQGLSSILRYSLETSQRESVTLGEELDIAIRYLELQAARFDDMEWTSQVSEDAPGIRIPPLLLQPLVENAVQHSRGASHSRVEIDAQVKHGELVISVTNTPCTPGVGGFGIGLRNTRERLNHFYDSSYQLELTTAEDDATVKLVLPPQAMK